MRSFKISQISSALGCLLLTLTSGCAFMPSVGPHASYVQDQVNDKKAPPLYLIDVKLATQIAQQVKIKEDNRERTLLSLLNDPIAESTEKRISSGDAILLTFWTQGTTAEAGDGVNPVTPTPSKPTKFIVDRNGRVDIPYAGLVKISNLTPHQAQNVIKQRLDATHEFENLEVSLQIAASHDQNIIVLGAVNKPGIIEWNEAGIQLSEAIAQAGGYTADETLHVSSSTSNNDTLNINISLSRKGTSYDIPLRLSLLNPIRLAPGDRLVVQHKPSVRVLCLGSGWTQPRMAGFSEVPTLSQVMASIGGLNPQSAQGRAIFILKHDRSVIYQVNFDKIEGMEASQVMPIEDGDMVYVPVTRSYTMQQVMTMLFTMASPGMMAAAASR